MPQWASLHTVMNSQFAHVEPLLERFELSQLVAFEKGLHRSITWQHNASGDRHRHRRVGLVQRGKALLRQWSPLLLPLRRVRHPQAALRQARRPSKGTGGQAGTAGSSHRRLHGSPKLIHHLCPARGRDWAHRSLRQSRSPWTWMPGGHRALRRLRPCCRSRRCRSPSPAAAQTGQTAEVADSITPDPTSKPVAADRSPGLPQQAASSAASRRRAASRRVRSLGAHDNEVHNRSTSRTLRPPCSMVRLRRYCAVSSHWWACQHLGAFHEVSCDLAASAVFQSREQELPRRVH